MSKQDLRKVNDSTNVGMVKSGKVPAKPKFGIFSKEVKVIE